MAAFVGKLVAKKIFKENASNGQGTQDPYFDKVPAKKMGVSYTKKQKKALHPNLSAEEVRLLTKVKRRAYRLDMALFSVPCIGRFGWSSVIGLVPAIGDVLDCMLAAMLIRTCCSVKPKLPSSIRTKMYTNLVFDFIIGLVPLLGDIADAVYKCNTKNAVLLEEELVKRAEKRRTGAGGLHDSNVDQGFVQNDEVSDNEYEMHGPEEAPPRYTSTRKPRRPDPAYDPRQAPGQTGYFGGRNEVDLEAGEGVPPQQPPRHQGSRSDRRN